MQQQYRISILIAAIALLGAVLWQVLTAAPEPVKVRSWSDPKGLGGWEFRSLPLGDSPAVIEKVHSLLSFDYAAAYEYRRGDERFSFFVSYWSPGKVPVRIVRGHVPEICWPEVGWRCVSAQAFAEYGEGDQWIPGGRELIMENGPNREHLRYWHLEDGRSVTSVAETSVLGRLRQFVEDGVRRPKEQIFLRINSNRPISEWDANAPVRQAIQGYLGRGLSER